MEINLDLLQNLTVSLFFYNIFLLLYFSAIRIAALWNNKAKLWVKGRRSFPYVKEKSKFQQTVWMHCASLGEFEQGRPVLENIKILYPQCKIVLTFFSSSGYERIKNYKGADEIFYLPADSKSNAKRFIALIKPTLVLWIKYEYWFHYLNELKQQNIPVLLISGVYRQNMIFFKWYGSLWRSILKSFTCFFVQNLPSKNNLEKLVHPDKIIHAGDTRFDRVKTIAENFTDIIGIKDFCGTNKVMVAGSTWEGDEAELIHFVKTHPEIKFIIAPHEIDKENLKDVKKEFPNSVFYTEFIEKKNIDNTGVFSNCLIIDNVGMLSRLYNYADITYVGGGFSSDGLHNILEAAVYGKLVIFGPDYEKNFEAEELIECGGAVSISSAIELEKELNILLNDDNKLKTKGAAAKNYVYQNAGATEKIIQYIQENLLLTN